MALKQLVTIITTTLILQGARGSLQDDALNALERLTDLTLAITSNFSDVLDNQWEKFSKEQSLKQETLKKELDDHVEKILDQISGIAANAVSPSLNITTCISSAQDDVESFVLDVKTRLGECYEFTMMDGAGIRHSIWEKANNEMLTALKCSNMSFENCNLHEDTTTCFEFVVVVIQKITKHLEESIDIIWKEALNMPATMIVPCREMVTQEIDLYLNLILDFVGTCVKSVGTNAIYSGC